MSGAILSGERFAAGRYSIAVLYADNHLLCVEKPANMPVQADASGDMDLLSACKAFLRDRLGKPGDAYLGLVHRLDRPVGGAMVFARTSKAASRLSAAFAGHTTDKRYWAVARGECREPLRLRDMLRKDERTGMVSVVPDGDPAGKEAILTATPLAVRQGLTLFEVALETGRAHQIRVQLRHAGYPLWGDARYGGGKPGEQIALWAHRLTVPHPTLKTPVIVLSAPPGEGAWRIFADQLDKEKQHVQEES